MNSHPQIRVATQADFPQLAEVMYDAIWNGPSQYSIDQKRAWCPEVRSGSDWHNRLIEQWIVVAEFERQVVGFMSLAANGYIDFAYIRPQHQGTGLFRKLFQCIELQALELGEARLWVHASLMAQPAFTKIGFEIVQAEVVEVRGERLSRFEMRKKMK
jgi:putative acetyltransferase